MKFLLLVPVAALPGLAALAVFGIVQTPDSPGYIAYARQIFSLTVPSGAALLAEAPAPLSLFRTPGYPAMLAVLMAIDPQRWPLAMVLLQIAAQACLAAFVFRAGLRLQLDRPLAALAALLPTIGFAAVVEISILTDALYAAFAAGAALLLLHRRLLWAGVFLAAATLLREATPFVALFYLPLAMATTPRRWLAPFLVLGPPALAAAALMAWNGERIAKPVLTTSRQTVMVQAVLPLLKQHLPVYDGNDLFDQVARETVGAGEYGMIDQLHLRLFHQGMAAPEMAAIATSRYWAAWQKFPLPMLLATLGNFRHEFLALPFQPVDTVGALMVYAGWPRPVFDRLNLLWAEFRAGSLSAGGFILLDVVTRLIGTVIGLLAIASPCRNRWRPDIFGLWIVCAGFFAVYLPVHIEPRYLVPVVPLACLLAAAAIKPARPASPSNPQ